MGDMLGYARVSTGDQDVAWQTLRFEEDALARLREKIVAGRKTLGEVYGPPMRGIVTGLSTTVASMLPVWSSPGRVWEGRSGDVCCDLVRVAGGLGARVGGAQGADRTGVRQGRNTGDRRSLSRWLVVRGRAQNRLAAGRAGGA